MTDPRFEYIRHQILLDYKTEKPNIIPKRQMTNQTPCNHRTPPKYNVEYLDDKMVIVNGIQYQRVEGQKPQTLLEIILDWWVQDWTADSKTICEQLVNTIESEWLPNDDPHDGEEYQLGWNACLEYLRKKLK
jgi:hypothetical protein